MAEALEVDELDWLRNQLDHLQTEIVGIKVQQAVNTTKLSFYAGLSGGASGALTGYIMQLVLGV